MDIAKFVSQLENYKADNPGAKKADIELIIQSFGVFTKVRALYVGTSFSVRVSEANTGSFSNVVLSLSALKRHDSLPVVICIVRPDRLDFRLANTTFLKKVSHSSHYLRLDKVRGSFLGHDIMEKYEDIPNRPDSFELLNSIHAEFSWVENLERLVGTTNSIEAKLTRFEPTARDLATIMTAPARASEAVSSQAFQDVRLELCAIIDRNHRALLEAAALDNVNLRGNQIEAIITGETSAHRLDDIVYRLPNGAKLVVDIKTKLLNKASAPKAYNIDKMLTLLATPDSVFAFFFIGIDAHAGSVRGQLVSMFDPTIVRSTRIQHHWASRTSRGVTQLTGDITSIFNDGYRASVAVEEGEALLRSFIEK
jgi:hypothetical protein